LLISELVYLFVQLLDLRLALVEQVVFQIDHVGETLVAVVLVLQLVLDFVACFIHRVQLVDQVVVVSPRRRQLLLHLVVIDLQCAQLQLVLVSLRLVQLYLTLELLNFLLALAIDLTETNHFSLVLLQLTRRVLQILHQCFGLLFVDME